MMFAMNVVPPRFFVATVAASARLLSDEETDIVTFVIGGMEAS